MSTGDTPDVDLVAPAHCLVGAPCVVHVRIACPETATCSLEAPARLGPFELVQVVEGASTDGTREFQATLLGFDPGAVELPALPVRIVRTDGTVHVVSSPPGHIDLALVETGEAATLRPDASPADPGPDWRVVGGGVFGAVLVVILGWLAWRAWMTRRERAAHVEPLHDAAAAIAEIEAIAATPAATPDDTFLRYGELSDALRAYLGLPLEVPATALTSTEIVDALLRMQARRRTPADAIDHSGVARDAHALLSHIDAVKFGAARPGELERAEACRAAVRLVTDVEARFREHAGASAHVA